MRYICENDHIFEHTAKLRILSKNEEATIKARDSCDILEVPVCPICETRIYAEYVLDKKRITSVLSVDISEVDAKLKEGYEVEALYAKTATLVRSKIYTRTPKNTPRDWSEKQ